MKSKLWSAAHNGIFDGMTGDHIPLLLRRLIPAFINWQTMRLRYGVTARTAFLKNCPGM